MEYLQVTYQIAAPEAEAAALAESVLLEQSIETPVAVAQRYPFVRGHMMGRIREVVPGGPGLFRVEMDLPAVTASVDPAQFVNVLYGNASLHENVVLLDFNLPEELSRKVKGPRFGLEGLRAYTGVYNRPFTCSALKPVGLSVDEIATLCHRFAQGGLDFIKDDHYLGDHPFCPFEARVLACQQAVEDVAHETGHRAVYVPNLSGTPDQIRRQAEFAQQTGVGAVMVAPMLIGLPSFADLVRRDLSVPVLAHPSFAGSARIREDTLYGKLFRMMGADAVIFASYGGRFSMPKETCGRIADIARKAWGGYRPALPVPAGGMSAERTPELITFYGMDTMLLVGGSLLEAGDALADRSRAFTDSVKEVAAGMTRA
jgi:ribulose-bisphosphate carboxylase large chain